MAAVAVQGVALAHAQGTRLDNMNVIRNLLPFLTHVELMGFRQLSKNWNESVLICPKVRSRLNGKIVDRWYQAVAETDDFEDTLKWNSCELFHFMYRGTKVSFKNYWHNAASLLDKLIINRCSMECDGLALLLDHSPHLKTLIMTRSNFRDLDDFHNHPHFHRNFPDAPPAPVVISPIRHLTLDNVNKIEQCFMDYLIARTGSLESLTVAGCFNSTELNLPPTRHTNEMQKNFAPRPTMEARFDEFEKNLCTLFVRNAGTLTKIGFHANNFQSKLFSSLASRPGCAVPVKELALTVLPDQDNYQSLIQFMNNCRDIEKLSLSFEGDVTNEVIEEILKPHKTIVELEITIASNRILNTIQLPQLQSFLKLERLKIMDSKVLSQIDIGRIYGGRRNVIPRWRRRQPANDNSILRGVETKMNPEFLANLPASLTKLSLNKYITMNDLAQNVTLESPALDSFRRLTKLEIRGPYVHSMNTVFPTIIRELILLETLVVTNCGVNDTHVTGLTEAEIKDLRKCVTFGLVMRTAGTAPTGQEILDRANQQMQLQPQAGIRTSLTNLTGLKHLDLSLNAGITDVGLMNGLRIPDLRVLKLNSCYSITDCGMDYVSENFSNLVELWVGNCGKLSKYGLNKVVQNCRQIRHVYTTRAVRARDIVAFDYTPSPNYDGIVKIKSVTSSENYGVAAV